MLRHWLGFGYEMLIGCDLFDFWWFSFSFLFVILCFWVLILVSGFRVFFLCLCLRHLVGLICFGWWVLVESYDLVVSRFVCALTAVWLVWLLVFCVGCYDL